MLDLTKSIIKGQFEAALAMLRDCLDKCPADQWDQPIGKYPFWHVAYHALMFVDLYLSPSAESFQVRDGRDGGPILHPQGWKEFDDEYPSRRFSREELLEYLHICRRKLLDTIDAETEASLRGSSGQPHIPFTRAEHHLHNLRHVQHHTGQLSAALRRVLPEDAGPKWVKTGWK